MKTGTGARNNGNNPPTTERDEPVKAIITTTIEIDSDQVRDLLVTAFEGGSNYWYADLEPGRKPTSPDSTDYGSWPAVYPTTGGSVMFADAEDAYHGSDGKPFVSTDAKGRYVLNATAIKRGFSAMADAYPLRFAQWQTEDYDAEDADVFLQCCIFGEVIYG